MGLVRLKGLEPTRVSAREPKSRMSTNSITGAYKNLQVLYHTPLPAVQSYFSPSLFKICVVNSYSSKVFVKTPKLDGHP